jgi:hypothetical protein
MSKKLKKRRENSMSYLHDKHRKVERLIQKIKDTMTIENMKNLNPENKEDKKLFQSAIESFNTSVQSFEKVQQETVSIKGDIGEIKQDLLIIKTKIDK